MNSRSNRVNHSDIIGILIKLGSVIIIFIILTSITACEVNRNLEKGVRNMIVKEYFSSNYQEARKKFLKACRETSVFSDPPRVCEDKFI